LKEYLPSVWRMSFNLGLSEVFSSFSFNGCIGVMFLVRSPQS
jgi:hypothetical protein